MIGRRAKMRPVLGHREGRSHVVTIHPALPDVDDDAVRRVPTRLLPDYRERFPEQCYSLAFDALAGPRAWGAVKGGADPRYGAVAARVQECTTGRTSLA